MVQFGFSIPTPKPIQQTTQTNPIAGKSITADKFISAVEKNYGKIPNEEVDQKADQLMQNGVNIIGWDQFKQAHQQFSEQQTKQSTLGKIGTIAGVGAGIGYAIGKPLEKVGEVLYGSAFKESPEKAAAIIRGNKDVKGIKETAIETPGVYGSQTRIGKKAYQAQQKIWEKEISPYIKKDVNVMSIDDLGKEIKNGLTNAGVSKQRIGNMMQEVDGFINELKPYYKDGITQAEAQKLTSDWGSDLASTFKKGSKDLAAVPKTDEYKGMLLEARRVLRDKLYTSMEKEFGNLGVTKEGVKKSFKNYGNLGSIITDVEKQLQTKLLGSTLGATSTVIKEVGIPAATIGGKILKTVGKTLAMPAEKVVSALAKGGKAALNILKKGLLSVDPINAPQLLQYVPGTIGDISKKFIKSVPALDILNELGRTDEDRYNTLKKEYPQYPDELLKGMASGKYFTQGEM